MFVGNLPSNLTLTTAHLFALVYSFLPMQKHHDKCTCLHCNIYEGVLYYLTFLG
jgi:hypothetical protein